MDRSRPPITTHYPLTTHYPPLATISTHSLQCPTTQNGSIPCRALALARARQQPPGPRGAQRPVRRRPPRPPGARRSPTPRGHRTFSCGVRYVIAPVTSSPRDAVTCYIVSPLRCGVADATRAAHICVRRPLRRYIVRDSSTPSSVRVPVVPAMGIHSTQPRARGGRVTPASHLSCIGHSGRSVNLSSSEVCQRLVLRERRTDRNS